MVSSDFKSDRQSAAASADGTADVAAAASATSVCGRGCGLELWSPRPRPPRAGRRKARRPVRPFLLVLFRQCVKGCKCSVIAGRRSRAVRAAGGLLTVLALSATDSEPIPVASTAETQPLARRAPRRAARRSPADPPGPSRRGGRAPRRPGRSTRRRRAGWCRRSAGAGVDRAA